MGMDTVHGQQEIEPSMKFEKNFVEGLVYLFGLYFSYDFSCRLDSAQGYSPSTGLWKTVPNAVLAQHQAHPTHVNILLQITPLPVPGHRSGSTKTRPDYILERTLFWSTTVSGQKQCPSFRTQSLHLRFYVRFPETKRLQTCSVGSSCCLSSHAALGVPQGTVLGPGLEQMCQWEKLH